MEPDVVAGVQPATGVGRARSRARGTAERICFEDISAGASSDFDGKPDLVGHHPDGELKPTRFEKYKAKD